MDEWKHFYAQEPSKKDLFLPFLHTAVYDRVNTLWVIQDTIENYKVTYNPLLGRIIREDSKKKKNVDKEGESSWESGLGVQVSLLLR